MENASKALIIAGAILLSILIIGLGMAVFNQAKDALTGTGLTQQQIATYNAEFLSYEGLKSGTDVRSLLQTVINHNLANQEDPSRNIKVQTSDASEVTVAPDELVTTSEVNTIRSGIRAGYTYKVTFGYDSKSGLIVAVGVEKQ